MSRKKEKQTKNGDILNSTSATMFGILLILILAFLWCVQQSNINLLEQEISNLEQNVEQQKINKNQFTEKDKLAFKKDIVSLKKDKASSQNAIWVSLIQAVGGAFFFVTAYMTYRNIKATEDKQIAERFSKAVEQLGSNLTEVRLGGIYALERIAINSPSDHWTVMEVLTAFVRQKSIDLYRPHLETENIDSDISVKVPIDIQAAMTVIGRRDSEKDPEDKILDLRSAFLPQANLAGAVLNKANFIKADLRGANLRAANLKEADLYKAFLRSANLENANLTEAKLVKTDLRRAGLGGATLKNVIITGAILERASLANADVKGTDFSECVGLTEQQLKNCKKL